MRRPSIHRPSSWLLLALLAPAATAQTTWYVDDDGPGDPFPGVSIPGNPAFSDPAEDGSAAHPYDDVEKAVGVAVNGDTVLVLPSNYIGYYALTSSIDMLGKAITVRSSDGADVTVLDGTGIPGVSGMLLNGNSVIEGLTFQNFDKGSLTTDFGGAMKITGVSAVVRSCEFLDNHAYRGGAIHVLSSNALIEDCLFLDNFVLHQGGAIFVEGGHPVLSGSHLEGNTAKYGGAVIVFGTSGSLFTVEDCVFLQNAATDAGGYGGALSHHFDGDILIERTRFMGNSATNVGGAVHLEKRGTIRSSTFESNVCTNNKGAGVHVSAGATVSIESSTFTGNQGGAVAEDASVTYCTLVNCISWANSPFELTGSIGVTYSDVLGGYPGTGNLDVDPLFENALGLDGMAGTLDDDLSLFSASPCIDAGNANAAAFPYPLDLAGNARVVDHPGHADTGVALVGQSIDLGAYEVQHVVGHQLIKARRKL